MIFYAGTKQPGEFMPYGVDFGALMDTTETITPGSSTIKATRLSDGVDVTATFITGTLQVTGTVLKFTTTDGADKTDYSVELKAWISAAKILEAEVIIPVRED